MRSPLLLACAVLGACSASDDDWNRIQRERLERLYAPRRPEGALAGVLRHEPRGAAQEPQHIDQREPPRRPASDGPRRFNAPAWTATTAIGAGTVAVRAHGTHLDDRADATFLHAGIHASAGVGLSADLWSSDDSLFTGLRISNGVEPAAADTNLRGVDVFPHVYLEPIVDDFRLPMRAGVFVDWQQLDHDLALVEREWLSIGPRVLFEPTWCLLGGGAEALDLVLRAGGDVGPAWFSEEFVGGDDRDTTARWGGEVGVVLRARTGALQAEVGWRLQHTVFGEIDAELYGSTSRTETQRQQLFVGFGLTY